ncbi:hypothetical protein AB0C52_01270 [Streptomyces sp. NPDC048717]|uniref:hypothetical protein n=1 Tax=Streptomyces sp. NPDC048717 TaxID=3154928 RepID=UPI00343D2EA3
MKLTLPGAVKAIAVTSVVLLAVACESAPGKQGEESAEQRAMRVCRQVFGAEDVQTLTQKVGDGVKAWMLPPSRVRERLLEDARKWDPESESHKWRNDYTSCGLDWYGEGQKKYAYLIGEVRWSYYTMESAKRGVDRAIKLTEGVYATYGVGAGYKIIFPCRVAGAPQGQLEGMPLEVDLWGSGVNAADSALRSRMLGSFARDMQKLLGCSSSPRIPDNLAVPRSSQSGPN